MLRLVPQGPIQSVEDALAVGDGWDSSKEPNYYIGAISRHLGKYMAGERLDPKGGHHHLSAVIVRCFQLLDKES